MELIPAIDLRGGRVVRLSQGDYERERVYGEDPAAVARGFVEQGARRLHVVDLDGAREGEAGNAPQLQAILDAVRDQAAVQVGGGIRSPDAVSRQLAAGAARVVMGTVALESPDLLEAAATRHPGRVILGLDARAGRVATRGWRETSDVTVEEVLERFRALPLAALLYTDISRDGMLSGPNLRATALLARRSPVPVLASGGVASLEDLDALAAERVIAGAVVGRALYTGAIDLRQALTRLAAASC
ncbi:MAG: 1-(5-phosphoribosyl)-5-[(5-phosphoribosylamino)methylideneamino]imidazole-4-carboxamide isomerase [Myxococcota bacterium]